MNSKDKNRIKQTAFFVEELAWLLKSKKNVNLEDTALFLHGLVQEDKENLHLGKSSNTNIHDLVGMLPFLFQDKDLFPINKDIIDFAENLFSITITRQSKRTRYELIGLVVTEITKLDQQKLENVISALSAIANDSEKLKLIKKAKKEIHFSWNTAISNLNK